MPLADSITGSAGAVASTVAVAGSLTLPSASVAVTEIGAPVSNVSGAAGLTDQIPPGSLAVAVRTSPPTVTSIVLPGSAVPLTSLPLDDSITGSAGAVASTVAASSSL